MFKFKPLAIALATAAASSAAFAGNIYIEATGYGVDQETSVQGIPGYSSAPSTAIFQLPRLGNYGGGPGWPATLQLVLDDTTGVPSSFTLTLDSDQVFGSGGPQNDIRYAGRNYTSVNLAAAGCTAGPAGIDFSGDPLSTRPAVPAGGDGSGATGQLVIHCPGAGTNTFLFAQLNDRTGLCATATATTPNSPTAAPNGCTAAWAGDPTGAAVPGGWVPTAGEVEVCLSDAFDTASAASGNFYGVESIRPHQLKTPGGVTAAFTFDLGNGGGPEDLSLYTNAAYPNPQLECTTNGYRNNLRTAEHQNRGGRNSGTFIIDHTGSLAGGDFQATAIKYVHDVDGASVGLAGPFQYQSYSEYDFASIEQSVSNTNAKNVPAMGAFGLAALFGGLVAVAARLRRRVS